MLISEVLKTGVLGVKLLGAGGGGGFLYCLGDTVAKRKCENHLVRGELFRLHFRIMGVQFCAFEP